MHHLAMISGKEVTYFTRGIVVEWSYKTGNLWHWDYAVCPIAATGSLSKWVVCDKWPTATQFNRQKWHGAHSYHWGRTRKQGRLVRAKTLHKALFNWIY